MGNHFGRLPAFEDSFGCPVVIKYMKLLSYITICVGIRKKVLNQVTATTYRAGNKRIAILLFTILHAGIILHHTAASFSTGNVHHHFTF